jgi:HSP20 family protein
MAITTYWDPFREANSLQRRLNSLFDDYSRQQGEGSALTMGSFLPAVDIYEDEHTVTLTLEVPGVPEKDLDVQIENNLLTVRGERKFNKDEKEENFHRIERRYGSFSRSFTLPSSVDTASIQAGYEHGVLRINLAKKAETKPRQVKVTIGGNSGGGSNRSAAPQLDTNPTQGKAA